ncbi:hypothetical protein PMI29_05582 [Pseudomonas sp. GM49]|nr:hypothetical protein PMI29_05582 [Pseudomonas sp. GM49]MDF9776220.1 hypothetical protein [Pseudomonas baetica]
MRTPDQSILSADSQTAICEHRSLLQVFNGYS